MNDRSVNGTSDDDKPNYKRRRGLYLVLALILVVLVEVPGALDYILHLE